MEREEGEGDGERRRERSSIFAGERGKKGRGGRGDWADFSRRRRTKKGPTDRLGLSSVCQTSKRLSLSILPEIPRNFLAGKLIALLRRETLKKVLDSNFYGSFRFDMLGESLRCHSPLPSSPFLSLPWRRRRGGENEKFEERRRRNLETEEEDEFLGVQRNRKPSVLLVWEGEGKISLPFPNGHLPRLYDWKFNSVLPLVKIYKRLVWGNFFGDDFLRTFLREQAL